MDGPIKYNETRVNWKVLRTCTWKLDDKFNITFMEVDTLGPEGKQMMMKADAESERMMVELMTRPEKERIAWVEKHLSKLVKHL